MLKPFIHDNFLLQNKYAERLFHETAKNLPVLDPHNHLVPRHLANDHRFQNMTQLWIVPDQYKHRAMRINGIPEEEITGDAPDKVKFMNWAKTFPHTLGNPLFHWNCLELKRIFGIDEILNEHNAEAIWDTCNERLKKEGFSTIGILKKWNVEKLCTSDELLDDLQPHVKATNIHGIQVWPSLRGDSIVAVDQAGYTNRLEVLSSQTNIAIHDLETFKTAVQAKLNDFQEAGCLFTDHALDADFRWKSPSTATANTLFEKRIAGETLNPEEVTALQSYLLLFLGKEYALRNWVLQLHIGAQRNTSSRLLKLAGSAGGYACIGNSADVSSIVNFLAALEKEELLPRVILYTLNPNDNEAFATITGSFTEDGVAGKIQFGPAWWYNDHYDGIQAQLKTLASYGMLRQFIGFTTDSRSLLSFSRHEYFRRIFCNLLGEWVAQGHLPADWELLNSTVEAVCYRNIKNWITYKKVNYAKEKIT